MTQEQWQLIGVIFFSLVMLTGAFIIAREWYRPKNGDEK